MSNYDLQKVVTLPCTVLPGTQETPPALLLERHPARHVLGGQPKQGSSSCVTPPDISHLPCTVCRTRPPQSI